ncbi:Oxidoreductase NAD-binding [Fragilaria crotonensis]|nr:Oxidoreductase NAD-binding [Fragilaria crotonensis]
MTYLPGRILAKRAASRTVTLLDLSIPHLKYQPGQWLDFTTPSASWIGGFSIASGPDHREVIQIAVKESNHPPARWVTNESKAGDEILVQVGGTCLLSPRDDALILTLTQSSGWTSPGSESNVHYQLGRGMTHFLTSTERKDDVIYYICGPPGMQDEAISTLQQHGVSEDGLVYEKWW